MMDENSLLSVLNGSQVEVSLNSSVMGVELLDLYHKERRKQSYVENINYTKVSITAVIMFGFPVVVLATFCIIRLKVSRLQRDDSFILGRRNCFQLMQSSSSKPLKQNTAIDKAPSAKSDIEENGAMNVPQVWSPRKPRTIFTCSYQKRSSEEPMLNTDSSGTRESVVKYTVRNEVCNASNRYM